MGITGLHTVIKPILKKTALINYKNQTFGIDGHAWLYQIAHVFAEEIYYKIPINKHAKLFLEKINRLRQFNIKPIVVFDGDPLKAKEVTNLERKMKKEGIREEIRRCLSAGNHHRAKMLMRQCISVDHSLLAPVIDILKRENVEYLIAPYESDAQLVYLQKIKYIDCIVTEDSDLVVFGADRVLYKFDGSHVFEYRRSMLKFAKDDFFATNILTIAILSGCDYIKSIKGIGLLTAHKLLLKHKTVEKCLEFIQSTKKIPEKYLEEFEFAILNFKHHIVYDPLKKNRVYLNEPISLLLAQIILLGEIKHSDPHNFALGMHIIKSNGPLEELGATREHLTISSKKSAKRIIISKQNHSKKINDKKCMVADNNTKCSLFDDI